MLEGQLHNVMPGLTVPLKSHTPAREYRKKCVECGCDQSSEGAQN